MVPNDLTTAQRAEVLIHALPYIQRYTNKIIVEMCIRDRARTVSVLIPAAMVTSVFPSAAAPIPASAATICCGFTARKTTSEREQASALSSVTYTPVSYTHLTCAECPPRYP